MGDVRLIPESKCPVCGHVVSAAGGEAAAQEPNDYVLCACCGVLVCFGDDLRLRLLTDEDLAELARSEPEAWTVIEAVRNELKLGTKHYDKRRPDVVLTDEREILQALVDGNLLIEPVPARRGIFRRRRLIY